MIADTTDNAGGGAPSDNTTFLHRLIARGVQGAAVAPIWDPIAVRLAFDAGEGARLPFRFGGKVGKTSGMPVDAEVEVDPLRAERAADVCGRRRCRSAMWHRSARVASRRC